MQDRGGQSRPRGDAHDPLLHGVRAICVAIMIVSAWYAGVAWLATLAR